MIGVFDSGRGGIAALSKLRELMPKADLAMLADRKNAPYGTKSEKELIPLVARDIERLSNLGASRILIACCTASSVYNSLSGEKREISYPIIPKTALEAANITKCGRVAVIATERTVSSHAFKNELTKLNSDIQTKEISAGELVSIVEALGSEKEISETDLNIISEISSHINSTGCDTLILGCTHFSHLRNTISRLCPTLSLVDSAEIGAKLIYDKFKAQEKGNGRTVYLE